MNPSCKGLHLSAISNRVSTHFSTSRAISFGQEYEGVNEEKVEGIKKAFKKVATLSEKNLKG